MKKILIVFFIILFNKTFSQKKLFFTLQSGLNGVQGYTGIFFGANMEYKKFDLELAYFDAGRKVKKVNYNLILNYWARDSWDDSKINLKYKFKLKDQNLYFTPYIGYSYVEFYKVTGFKSRGILGIYEQSEAKKSYFHGIATGLTINILTNMRWGFLFGADQTFYDRYNPVFRFYFGLSYDIIKRNLSNQK